jgi:MATE family multidrug resistance protein
MMGWIGTVELAAHGIAMQAASLAFMVHLGLSNAITVRTGFFDGAGDGAALRDGALVGIGLSLAIGLLMVAGFLLFPAQIVAIFLDMTQPESAQIVAFGTVLMALAALFLVMDAMQVIALGLLRGVQDTRVPMALAAVSYWGIGIPSSYVLAFPLGFGGVGLWLGLVVGLLFAAGLLMARFWARRWRPFAAPAV